MGVPDSAVGALIGSGGAVIKHMMRASGAFLTVCGGGFGGGLVGNGVVGW